MKNDNHIRCSLYGCEVCPICNPHTHTEAEHDEVAIYFDNLHDNDNDKGSL